MTASDGPMMHLHPSEARAIARGRQTTMRIPARPGKAGAPYAPCPFKAGHEYPIPEPLDDLARAAIRRGDKPQPPPIGHVRVVAIPREALRVTAPQAKSDGYDSVDAFKLAWVRRWDRAWLDRERTARDFNWARYTGQGTVQWMLRERYRQRWEGRTVWAVQFELVTEMRFLAQPNPLIAQDDYTSTLSRAIDELPVIERSLQEVYAKKARERSLATRETFQYDLERERARRKGLKRPYPQAA